MAIMGPSGAGKLALLGSIGMLDGARQDEYYFLDQEVHTLNASQRNDLHGRYIGFVFQQHHLLDHLIYRRRTGMSKSPSGRVSRLTPPDWFQILSKKDLYPNQPPGGQQQLVAAARAVMGNPKLFLADEPSSLHSTSGRRSWVCSRS